MYRNMDHYLQTLERELRLLPSDKRKEIIEQIRGDYGDNPQGGFHSLTDPKELAKEFLYDTKLTPASLISRLGAALADTVLLGALFIFVVLAPLFYIGNSALSVIIAVFGSFLFISTVFLYFPIFEGSKGQTPGKWMLGLLVVQEDGRSINYGSAFLRRIPLWFGFFFFDAITVFFFPKHQRAFDRVAKTLVVQSSTPRKLPMITVASILILSLVIIPFAGFRYGVPVFKEIVRWSDSQVPYTPPSNTDINDIANSDMWEFLDGYGLKMGEVDLEKGSNGETVIIPLLGNGYNLIFTAYKGNDAQDFVKDWSSEDNVKYMSVSHEFNQRFSIRYTSRTMIKQGWQRDNWGFTLEGPKNKISKNDFSDLVKWISLQFKTLD